MIFKNSQRRQFGFTLVEIMVVVTIIGILGAVAIPFYLSWIPGYRFKSAIRDLQGHFQTIKAEAVKRGVNLNIEFVNGAYTQAGQVGGYSVFVDNDSDNHFDAGEVLITGVTMPKNVSLTATTFAVNGIGTNTAMSFNSRGLPNMAGTITLRNSQDINGIVNINLTGRIQLQRSISTDGGVTWSAPQNWD